MSSVSSSKSLSMDVHLFALDPRRETQHHNDQVSLSSSIERVLSLPRGHTPHQTRFGASDGLEILNLHRIGVSLLQVDLLGCGGRWPMSSPVFRNQIAFKPNAVAVLTGETDQVVAGFRRNDYSFPAHGIVPRQLRGNAGKAPREVNHAIRARQSRIAFQVDIGKVCGLQTMPFE